ncbi:unnamed protein product [Brassica oleracea]
MAFLRSLQVEEMALTSKSRKYGFVAWMLSTSVGLSLSFLSKSSVLLGISLTMPLMVACLSVAVPIWMHNRYQFWFPQLCGDQARDPRFPRMKGFILWICLVVFAGSVMALGAIISSKPLDDLKYKLFSAKGNNFMSPYTSSVYLGWAMASGIALVVTAILPIVSWFATYRFSHSSAISLVIFSGNRHPLSAFCPFFWVWSHSLLGGFKFNGTVVSSVHIFKQCVNYFCFSYVLLSPPIVVYSPRVLPVYVYDAHADCGKNVSAAFLVLYGIALAAEGWGVVASLIVYPPFAGAAVSAITLVVSFGFAVSLIITPEYNEEGIYTVRFCIQGEWVPVVIDDWIPCESPGKPAFATSKRLNELWVSIVEKAYAKLHGSYEALEGGLVQDALVDLTGEGFLLGAGSPSGSDVHVSSSGIVQGHAYSVLQVREVDGHRLVQIRNPWANEVEWNGPWSDSSPERSDRMKHKLKHVLQVLSLVTYPFALKYVCVLIMRVQQSNEVDGQWRNCSAGGCQDYSSWHQNPQFLLRATGSDASLPIHVFITLTQADGSLLLCPKCLCCSRNQTVHFSMVKTCLPAQRNNRGASDLIAGHFLVKLGGL